MIFMLANTIIILLGGGLTGLVVIKSNSLLSGLSVNSLEVWLNFQNIIFITLLASLILVIGVWIYVYIIGSFWNITTNVVTVIFLIVVVLLLITHLIGLVLSSSLLSLNFISVINELFPIQFSEGLQTPSLLIWTIILSAHPITVTTSSVVLESSLEYWLGASLGLLGGSTLILTLFVPIIVFIIPTIFCAPIPLHSPSTHLIKDVNNTAINHLNSRGQGVSGFSGHFKYNPGGIEDLNIPQPTSHLVDNQTGLPQMVGVNLPTLSVQEGLIQFPPIPAVLTPTEVEQTEVSRILIQSLYDTAQSEEHLSFGLGGLYYGEVEGVPVEGYNPLEIGTWGREILRLWRLRQ